MITWLKNLFKLKPKKSLRDAFAKDFPNSWGLEKTQEQKNFEEALKKFNKAKPKRPRLYKQATVVTTGELPKESEMATKPGLYANIHAKQERIKNQKASGAKKVETMRKPGTKGAPTAKDFKEAAKTAKPAKKK